MLSVDYMKSKISAGYRVYVCLIIFSIFGLPEIYGNPQPAISIIIDDVGDNKRLGYQAAELPAAVALSILPHTPYSKEIATFGYNRGMDIMLHQPMESMENNHLLGPGALLQHMNRQDFVKTLENNLNAIPYVVGINNHMGSLLTTDIEKMSWLMVELNYRNIFFIDSRTTNNTVADKTAQYWQSPAMSRRIFLDHIDDLEAIARQFELLLKQAKKYGHAIAIGHPRINTLKLLEMRLPDISKEGFSLVSPSELIRMRLSDKPIYDPHAGFIEPLHLYNTCHFPSSENYLKTLILSEISQQYKCIGSH